MLLTTVFSQNIDNGVLKAMVKAYADKCFSSVAASEDQNWPQHWWFDSNPSIVVLEAYRMDVSAEALRLYVAGRWSQLQRRHLEVLFNAIQSYKPGTKLPYSMQLQWDAITMMRNILDKLTSQPGFTIDCMQHLVKLHFLRESPPTIATDGLTLPQFESWTDQLASKGHHEARQ